MDSLARMKELSAYYKGRYEKAVSMGITESSKYYAAFREIYLRYRSTETAAECMELLGKSLQEKDFRKNVYGTVELIASILSLGDAILNEEGNVEYIPKRIKLPKENQDAVEAYMKAKAAIMQLQKWDDMSAERGCICESVLGCFFDIVNWMLIARDTVYPVGRNRN